MELIASLDDSICRIRGRTLANDRIFSKNGFDILLFNILKNEKANEIIPVYSVLSKISAYSCISDSALSSGVLAIIVPLLYSTETSAEIICFSYKIIINIISHTELKETSFLSSFDFDQLPLVVYPYQTLEFLIMCSKILRQSNDVVASLNIIRSASKVKIVSDKTAFLLLWITAYLANNNQGDISI